MVRKVEEKQEEQQAMTTADLAKLLEENGIALFVERSGFPLNQAQRNLEGKTHYVDDSTLKAFVAKIHTVHILDDGLILGMVESLQAGPNAESGRVFRPVFFNIMGETIHRPSIEESFKSQKQAMAEFWKVAEGIDAIEETVEALDQHQANLEKEIQELIKLKKAIA